MTAFQHNTKENVKAELVSRHVQSLKDAIDVLFGEGGLVFNLARGRSTFTYQVHLALAQPIALTYWSFDKGVTTRVIGGRDLWSDSAVLSHVRGEMTAWARMVHSGPSGRR